MSFSVRPALASTLWVTGMTAVSMNSGSSASTAVVCTRARGRRPSWAARSSLAISRAAAPSVSCDDVPAVIDHSICGNRASIALVDEGRPQGGEPLEGGGAQPFVGGHEVPLAVVVDHLDAHDLVARRRPSRWRRDASSWERRPNSSSSLRDTPHLAAISSEATPWLIIPSG